MTSSNPLLDQDKICAILSSALLVCASTSSDSSSLVFGFKPICPEIYMSPWQMVACEQGPIALGPCREVKVFTSFDIDSVNNQCYINNMTQIILTTILNKIKSISKECDMIAISETSPKNQSEINVESYIKALEMIRGELIKFRQLEEEYYRLEAILQKAEADLRQKIGFQQQIKLYNDCLKAQVEQIEMEKLQLLQNSKRTIKQLKKVNQQLFAKLNSKVNNIDKTQDTKAQKNDVKNPKTERVRSFGGKTGSNAGITHKVRFNKEEQLKQIVKTQFIQRQQLSEGVKKKIGEPLQDFLDVGELKNMGNIGQSANINKNGGKTDREIIVSKKKQRNLYSNSNLFNMIRSNRRHQQRQLKEIYLPKTPEKKVETKKAKNKFKNINRSLWKDKLANKSVQSITSMQPVISNKETL